MAEIILPYLIKGESCIKEISCKGIEIVAVGIADANEAFLKKIASSSEAALKTDVNSMSGSFSSIAQAITEGKGNISLGK